MPVDVGTNSYVSMEDANAYIQARLNSSAWSDAVASSQEAALITATRAIDRLMLVGRRADADQPLAFPRYGQDAVPQAVIDATCEEALALLANGDSTRRQLQADGVTRFQIGTLSESYAFGGTGKAATPPTLQSLEARELMRPYIAGSVVIV
jgi:hypothetical protein